MRDSLYQEAEVLFQTIIKAETARAKARLIST